MDTTSAANNCNACGNVCTTSVANAQAVCASSACAIACDAGYSLCNGACIQLTTATNCGSCGNGCDGGTPVCSAADTDGGLDANASYSCVSGCPPATPTLCAGTCVDTSSNAGNCSSCGNVCTTGVANAQPACVGDACTFTCNTGYTLCNGSCVQLTTTTNCGSCGNSCPSVANGQPACVSGACTATCSSGYSLCGGACVQLTTAANCGSCGNACSGGTQLCVGSGSSYFCGGPFGGVYSDVDTSACGGIAQTCNAGVYLGNPLNSGACGCPPGYSTSTAMNLMNDQAGGNCGNGVWGWGSIYACYAGTSSTLTPANDFGGFYQTVASNCATPAPAQACKVGNPYASGGGCSCPTGWKTITTYIDGSNWAQGTLNFCWNSAASLTTFGGAYEGTDPGTGYGGATSTTGGCLVGNPAVTGTTCNCPTGTTAVSVRSIFGTPQTGCGNAAQYGSHVFVCIK